MTTIGQLLVAPGRGLTPRKHGRRAKFPRRSAIPYSPNEVTRKFAVAYEAGHRCARLRRSTVRGDHPRVVRYAGQ